MRPDHARRLLGVDPTADWASIRARHRDLIRTSHPDAGGDGRRAAEFNQALEVLRGEPVAAPVPSPVEVVAHPGDEAADRSLRLDVAPRELLMRLAEAGHAIGEVVFVDSVGGLLEVVVGSGSSAAQLAVTVGEPDAEGVPVAFMLEPLAHGGEAPPIGAIVDDLVAAVRAGEDRR